MTYNQLLKKLEDCEKIKEIDYTNVPVTNETDNLIKSNIFLCHPDTIYFYEIQKPSNYTISIVENQLNIFFIKDEKYNLILDLSRGTKPSVDIRDKLKTMFSAEDIKMVYVYVGQNIILKLLAKFIIGSMLDRNSLTFVSSREEAYNLSQAHAN